MTNNTITYTNKDYGCVAEVYSEISNCDLDSIMEFICNGHDLDSMTEFKFVDSGSYSKVYKFKNYAIKSIFSIENITRNNDRQAMIDLKNCKYIPKLYTIINQKHVVMEYINGDTLDTLSSNFSRANEFKIENMMNDFKDALYEIILSGYSPHDMHQGNVMFDYDRGSIRIIDLGWFFKHESQYNSSEEAENDYHYSTAMRWAGDYIRTIMSQEGVEV